MTSRIVRAVCVVVLASAALTGCALQADWDGSKKLASEECQLAAQLFTVSDAEKDRPELAEALHAYVPEDLHTLLDYFAYPLPPQGMSDEMDVAHLRVKMVRDWADQSLHEWARLSCGVGVAGEPAQRPDLSQMLAFESEAEGVRSISIAGALDPDHAVALCAEARLHEPFVQIEVTDAEAFPLAFAAASGTCDYHPFLFTGLEDDEAEASDSDS